MADIVKSATSYVIDEWKFELAKDHVDIELGRQFYSELVVRKEEVPQLIKLLQFCESEWQKGNS